MNLLFALLFSTTLGVQAGGKLSESHQVIGPPESGADLGFDVSAAGDINFDGFPDILAGAPGTFPGGLFVAGSAFVISGKDGTEIFRFDGTVAAGTLGKAVAGAGDANGDGIPDFVVGAPNQPEPGTVFVFSGADGTPLHQFDGTWINDQFGASVDFISDLNNDQCDEILIGAMFAQPFGGFNAGSLFVYSGKDGILLKQIDGIPGQRLGRQVAGLRDLNGDGIADFSASDFTVGLSGSVRVYSGADFSLLYRLDGVNGGGFFGSGIDGVGDIDGDGCEDLVVGAADAFATGAAFVHSGKTGDQLFDFYGNGLFDEFGGAVAGIGDINGDGFSDIGVGAYNKENTPTIQPGALYLYSGLDGSLIRTVDGANDEDKMGYSVSCIGDLNGDAIDEVMVGAPNFDFGGTNNIGAVYVYSFDPFLKPSQATISATTGGTLTFQHDFPDTEAGREYALLASSSREDSVFAGGIEIPLANHWVLQKTVNGLPPVFSGAAGTLDANGQATSTATLLPGQLSPYIGRHIAFASISLSAPGQPSVSSARVVVRIDP